MTPDEIIEVLQGFKAGRGWQFLSTANEWKTPILSSLESMLHALYSGQTIRLAPLPDEITIPARVIPAPLREAPEDGKRVFIADPFRDEFYESFSFSKKSEVSQLALARGLMFDSEHSAVTTSKAMCPYA